MTDRGRGDRRASADREDSVEHVATTLHTWAGISTARTGDGTVTFGLGPRRIGRVDEAGTVDVALPKPTWEHLVQSGRVEPHRVAPEARRASYYLPGHPRVAEVEDAPATVDDALWLLRVAYLAHALTLSHTAPGGDVLASIEVESELRDLDLDEEMRAIFDELRER